RLRLVTPRAPVNADTRKTYDPNTGEYVLAKCDYIATLAEGAGQFRDLGFSMQEFLDRMQKASVDDDEQVQKDTLAEAQTIAMFAYTHPSASPQALRGVARQSCLQSSILAKATREGVALAAMRFCSIDSLDYETLVHDIFQLLTTDATLLA